MKNKVVTSLLILISLCNCSENTIIKNQTGSNGKKSNTIYEVPNSGMKFKVDELCFIYPENIFFKEQTQKIQDDIYGNGIYQQVKLFSDNYFISITKSNFNFEKYTILAEEERLNMYKKDIIESNTNLGKCYYYYGINKRGEGKKTHRLIFKRLNIVFEASITIQDYYYEESVEETARTMLFSLQFCDE